MKLLQGIVTIMDNVTDKANNGMMDVTTPVSVRMKALYVIILLNLKTKFSLCIKSYFCRLKFLHFVQKWHVSNFAVFAICWLLEALFFLQFSFVALKWKSTGNNFFIPSNGDSVWKWWFYILFFCINLFLEIWVLHLYNRVVTNVLTVAQAMEHYHQDARWFLISPTLAARNRNVISMETLER